MRGIVPLPKTSNLMWLYEANHDRLSVLIPDLAVAPAGVIYAVHGIEGFRIELVERTAYTSLVALYQGLGEDGHFVRDPWMRVRIYHDARLAEVVGYQHHARFRPQYPYPNPRMYYPHEKRQINLFLAEWLNYCFACGCGYAVGLQLSPA